MFLGLARIVRRPLVPLLLLEDDLREVHVFPAACGVGYLVNIDLHLVVLWRLRLRVLAEDVLLLL